MPVLDIVIELIIETGRTVLIGELSERIRRVRMSPKPHCIAEIRRHVHRVNSRRLITRLLTDGSDDP